MSMENLYSQKSELREILKKKRAAISDKRREEAALSAKDALAFKGSILSFSPFGSEINLRPLNDALKSQGKLYLMPQKPNGELNFSLSTIDYILVPALGFDRNFNRIGYGKGFYDQFLAKVKNIPFIGIGFQEQLINELLPKDPWDIPVDELYLF